jgi:hypothetical protein
MGNSCAAVGAAWVALKPGVQAIRVESMQATQHTQLVALVVVLEADRTFLAPV